MPWSIRQTAIYHSFDLETGRALWINVKANQAIKDRIREATTKLPWYETGSRSEAFSATLELHMLLCDWASEVWRWYIDDLENRLHAYSAVAMVAPGKDSPSQQGVIQKSPSVSDEKAVVPESSDTLMPQEQSPPSAEGRDRRSIVEASFEDLQLIQHIEDKAREALLVLQLNLSVLEDMRQLYDDTVDHGEFPSDLRVDCHHDLARFHKHTLSIEKDFAMSQSRTKQLLERISNRKNLVRGTPLTLFEPSC